MLRGVTSEPAPPPESGGVPDMAALTRVVARQRAEMDRLQELAATSAVLERAKGALMAQRGCSPDAAQEELRRRAKAARRTLLEECWIALGALAGATDAEPTAPAPAPAPRPAPGPAPTPFAEEVDATALGRLSRALVRVGTPQDLAHRLLDHLAPDVGADAVMIYVRTPGGGLELLAHAGVDATVADQWSRVPPVSGIAALDSLRADEPRWLEDPVKDAEQYLLIGNEPHALAVAGLAAGDDRRRRRRRARHPAPVFGPLHLPGPRSTCWPSPSCARARCAPSWPARRRPSAPSPTPCRRCSTGSPSPRCCSPRWPPTEGAWRTSASTPRPAGPSTPGAAAGATWSACASSSAGRRSPTSRCGRDACRR